MDYDVHINLQKNILNVDLNISLAEDEKVYYYLCMNSGEVFGKSGWKKESHYSFELSITNRYFVKAFVLRNNQKYVKRTECFDYITEEDTEKFEKFCQKQMDYQAFCDVKPWYLYHAEEPFSNFCFFQGNCEGNKIEQFCQEYNFETINFLENGNKTSSLIKEKEIDFKRDRILISGIGRIEKNLILGNSNLNNDEKTVLSDEQLGTFTYCKDGGRAIEIGTDFFGMGKIYYFEDTDIFICSNNYHMLIILLKYVGKDLKINDEVVNALLCKMSQPFQQRFTRECEIANIFILPVGKKIVAKDKVTIVDSAIAKEFSLDKNISNKEYIELLQKGATEILDNAEAVLKCEKYDQIIVELTGGLDSRIVYAALTNFDLKEREIYINTVKGKNNQNDIDVANQVNNVYNFLWDNRSSIIKRRSYKNKQNEINSHFLMGGYYFPLENLPSNYDIVFEDLENEEKTIRLNGFFGEICCRPYFTRNILNKIENIEDYDIDQILPLIINQKDVLSIKSYKALCNVMKKELCQLPGRSPIEKYETFYLFYRNGIHCSKVREYERRGTWGVLQSKNLYRLCRKTYYQKKDIKVQLDVLNQINPILGCIPYEAEKDNEAKDRLKDELYYPDERYRNAVLPIKSDWNKWERAYEETREKINYITDEHVSLEQVEEENYIWKQEWRKRFCLLLHGLMRYKNGIFRETFGIDVFVSFFIKKDLSEAYYKTLYNKMLALFLQLRIVDDEYNEIFKERTNEKRMENEYFDS